MFSRFLRGRRAAMWAGVASLALLSGCQQAAVREFRSAEAVAVDETAMARAIDGNTLVLRDRGEAIYFSSKLATFLTRAERGNVFRRLIGQEVEIEGAFLARRLGAEGVEDLGGIGAVTPGHAGGVALAIIRTYAGEDRVVDFFARPREMMAVSITGFGEHLSCRATPWVSSRREGFSPGDFVQERCELRKGRAFDTG